MSDKHGETPLWMKVIGTPRWWLFPGSLIVVVLIVMVLIDF